MLSRTLGIKTITFVPSTIEPFLMSLTGTGPQHSSHINFISSVIGDIGAFSSLVEAQLSFKMRSLNFMTSLFSRFFGEHILMNVV